MKLESLNSMKFSDFKKNEIQDAFKILGGTKTATTYKSAIGGSGSDTFDDATNDGPAYDQGSGKKVDYSRNLTSNTSDRDLFSVTGDLM